MNDHERPFRNALLALLACLVGLAFAAFFCGLAAGNLLLCTVGGGVSLSALIGAVWALIRTARRMR